MDITFFIISGLLPCDQVIRQQSGFLAVKIVFARQVMHQLHPVGAFGLLQKPEHPAGKHCLRLFKRGVDSGECKHIVRRMIHCQCAGNHHLTVPGIRYFDIADGLLRKCQHGFGCQTGFYRARFAFAGNIQRRLPRQQMILIAQRAFRKISIALAVVGSANVAVHCVC